MLKQTKQSILKKIGFLLLAAFAIVPTISNAGDGGESKAETSRSVAAKQNKYTFIMFWKKQDAATTTMWKNLKNELSGRLNEATVIAVRANDPTEAKLVKEYGVSRAPMPMALAIAPNGAITGSFVKKLNAGLIKQSFVSPAKSHCMRTLQNRKMVLLCVTPSGKSGIPQGVQNFKSIPCYQKTVEVVTVSLEESAEASFVKELEVSPQSNVTTVVFMAPPGVMVGRFNENVTQQQLVGELVKSGKGCGDKNCKDCKK